MKRKTTDRIITFLLCASCAVQLTGAVPQYGVRNEGNALKAEASENDTRGMHIIFTAGMNGRINTVDFSNGKKLAGGLSRAAAAIKEIRSGRENSTILVDGGDMIGNGVTSMVHEDESKTQPIYKAAADLGYDVFVPGEEDMRYSADYFLSQMEKSGLKSAALLSNAGKDQDNYNSTITVKKTVTADNGEKTEITAGFIGEACYNSEEAGISFDDVQTDALKKAASLKKEGCTAVICVLHDDSRDSLETAEKLAESENIDLILMGHGESIKENRPEGTASPVPESTASPAPEDPARFVSEKPAEVNSSPAAISSGAAGNASSAPAGPSDKKAAEKIVYAGKYGTAAADITLYTDKSGKITSITRSTEDTSENEPDSHIENDYIAGSGANPEDQFSTISAETDSLTDINDYFGYIKDNGIIQLVNEINIAYGMKAATDSDDKTIADLPVVSGSRYSRDGSVGPEDYISLSGDITRGDLYDLVDTGKGLYAYNITGKQLKKIVEWSAGAYASPGEIKASVPTASAVSGNDYYEVVDKDRLNELLVFDGFEYTIDTSEKPCYTETGAETGAKGRVTGFTRNGKEIKDTDRFIFVSEKLPGLGIFDDISSSEVTHITAAQYRTYVNSYVEKAGKLGKIAVTPDNNWNIKLSPDIKYIWRSCPASASLARDSGFLSYLYKDEGYYVYELLVNDKFDSTDAQGPALFVSPEKEDTKAKSVKVRVQASAAAGIKDIRMLPGKYGKESGLWEKASKVTKNSFTCSDNGIYSVMAEDNNGVRAVKYIDVSNVDPDMLKAPKVNAYTNVSEKLSGSADPEATVCIETADRIYKTGADASGNFEYALEPQNAGVILYVYTEDKKGNVSPRTVVNVERGGPNRPVLTQIRSNSKNAAGKLNDTAAYPFIMVNDSDVYIMKGDALTFLKSSSMWKDSYKVTEVNSVLEDSGDFTLELPQVLPGGTEVKLYTVDILGRVSAAYKKNVTAEKPAKPSFSKSTVTNKSKKIVLYCVEQCTVTVKISGKTYKDTTGTYQAKKGTYKYSVKVPRTDSGVTVSAYSKNSQGNSATVSMKKTEKVPDKPVITGASAGSSKVTGKVDICGNSKGKNTVSNTKTKVYVTVKGKKYKAKVSKSGSFYANVRKLKKGMKVKVKAQNKNGKSLKASARVK